MNFLCLSLSSRLNPTPFSSILARLTTERISTPDVKIEKVGKTMVTIAEFSYF